MEIESSSSYSTIPQAKAKHEVFISFRGEDTRENFISHLYTGLSQKKIETFIDNNLTRGDEISSSLLDAIEESKISIVVLSKNYASSTWCLDELVKIMECKKTNGQTVIPVFYQVNPSDVRHQTGSFAVAFAKHEEYTQRLENLQKWRSALTETASLVGFDSATIRYESTLTEEIVREVSKRLGDHHLPCADIHWISWKKLFEFLVSGFCLGLFIIFFFFPGIVFSYLEFMGKQAGFPDRADTASSHTETYQFYRYKF